MRAEAAARRAAEEFHGHAARDAGAIDPDDLPDGVTLPPAMVQLGRVKRVVYETEAKGPDQEELGEVMVDYDHAHQTPAYIFGHPDGGGFYVVLGEFDIRAQGITDCDQNGNEIDDTAGAGPGEDEEL